MTTHDLAIDSEALDRIGLEVDMRLTDVWSMLFERGEDIDTEFLGWLLRLAYVTGYWDALSESERGSLCKQLGYEVPERRIKNSEVFTEQSCATVAVPVRTSRISS